MLYTPYTLQQQAQKHIHAGSGNHARHAGPFMVLMSPVLTLYLHGHRDSRRLELAVIGGREALQLRLNMCPVIPRRVRTHVISSVNYEHPARELAYPNINHISD